MLSLGSDRVDGSELRDSCCATGDPAEHIYFDWVGQGVCERIWDDFENGMSPKILIVVDATMT